MSQLREKLKVYGLDRPSRLARALEVSIQRAHQILNADTYAVSTARKIGGIIGLSWQEVYSWQENGR